MSDSDADWPVAFDGVTETVVTTQGPEGRWNVAALGITAPDASGAREAQSGESDADGEAAVTARTWGRTRTRRNFEERGGGFVQFTRDPVDFVAAALTVSERDDPVLDGADAWVRVDVSRRESGTDGGTEWVEWALAPRDARVLAERVPTIDRGHNAVVEATVAASRLDVSAYDTDVLLDRLAFFESVVERCGGPREREAFAVLVEQVDAEW